MAKLTGNVAPAASKPLTDPKRFMDAEFVRGHRHYTMRPGETIDDVKTPGSFKNIAAKFGMGDILEVRSADLTFWSQLMVVASDHVAAQVELRTLIETKLEPAGRKDYDADGYRIDDTGDVLRRLAVIRTADNKLMKDGFKSKSDAAHYISTSLMDRQVA